LEVDLPATFPADQGGFEVRYTLKKALEKKFSQKISFCNAK